MVPAESESAEVPRVTVAQFRRLSPAAQLARLAADAPEAHRAIVVLMGVAWATHRRSSYPLVGVQGSPHDGQQTISTPMSRTTVP